MSPKKKNLKRKYRIKIVLSTPLMSLEKEVQFEAI